MRQYQWAWKENKCLSGRYWPLIEVLVKVWYYGTEDSIYHRAVHKRGHTAMEAYAFAHTAGHAMFMCLEHLHVLHHDPGRPERTTVET